MAPIPNKDYEPLIAFYNTKVKAFYSNWDPEARRVRFFIQDKRHDSPTIKLFPKFSEDVVRVMYDLGEEWKAVEIKYDVFLNLLKEQGIKK